MTRSPWWGSIILAFATFGCATRAIPPSDFLLVDTEHVRLRTNVDEEGAIEIATTFQGIRDALADSVLRCGFIRESGRIEVTVLRPGQFRAVAGDRSIAALYRQWGVGYIADLEAQIVAPGDLGSLSKQTFQHELTHRLVANCFPSAPVWLHEGLASFFETAVVEDGKLSLGIEAFIVDRQPGAVPFSGEYRSVQVTSVPHRVVRPPSELLRLSPATFHEASGSDESRFRRIGNYASAWSLVHFLELGAPDLREPFSRYLNALHELNVDADTAWRVEFETANLDERVAEYIAGTSKRVVAVPYAKLNRPLPRVQRMSEGEAQIHIGWLWEDGSKERHEEALEHYAQAARFPTSRARARLVRALSRLQFGQSKLAFEDLRAGLAEEPDHPELLHAFTFLAEDGKEQRSLTPELLDAADRLARVARTPEQRSMVATMALLRGNPDEALAISEAAVSEKPQAWSCQFARAQVLAGVGRIPEAAVHLVRTLNIVSHSSPGLHKSILEAWEALRRQQQTPSRERADATPQGK